MYKHSANRDDVHTRSFTCDSLTVQGITHLAIFSHPQCKKTLTGLSFPPQTLALLSYFTC